MLPCYAPAELGSLVGNRGPITGFCHSLKWVSLSTLSPEIKALTKLSGVVFALQQLEEELERPDMGPMAIYARIRDHALKSRLIQAVTAPI
jgi:hypothetical protein